MNAPRNQQNNYYWCRLVLVCLLWRTTIASSSSFSNGGSNHPPSRQQPQPQQHPFPPPLPKEVVVHKTTESLGERPLPPLSRDHPPVPSQHEPPPHEQPERTPQSSERMSTTATTATEENEQQQLVVNSTNMPDEITQRVQQLLGEGSIVPAPKESVQGVNTHRFGSSDKTKGEETGHDTPVREQYMSQPPVVNVQSEVLSPLVAEGESTTSFSSPSKSETPGSNYSDNTTAQQFTRDRGSGNELMMEDMQRCDTTKVSEIPLQMLQSHPSLVVVRPPLPPTTATQSTLDSQHQNPPPLPTPSLNRRPPPLPLVKPPTPTHYESGLQNKLSHQENDWESSSSRRSHTGTEHQYRPPPTSSSSPPPLPPTINRPPPLLPRNDFQKIRPIDQVEAKLQCSPPPLQPGQSTSAVATAATTTIPKSPPLPPPRRIQQQQQQQPNQQHDSIVPPVYQARDPQPPPITRKPTPDEVDTTLLPSSERAPVESFKDDSMSSSTDSSTLSRINDEGSQPPSMFRIQVPNMPKIPSSPAKTMSSTVSTDEQYHSGTTGVSAHMASAPLSSKQSQRDQWDPLNTPTTPGREHRQPPKRPPSPPSSPLPINPPLRPKHIVPNERLQYQRQQQRHPPKHPTRPGGTMPPRGVPQQPPQTRRAQPTKQSSASWKNQLWGRIEKSLDRLANLEDKVSDGALRLVETATKSTSSFVGGRTESTRGEDDDITNAQYNRIQQLWKSSSSSSARKSSRTAPAPSLDMSRFQKKVPLRPNEAPSPQVTASNQTLVQASHQGTRNPPASLSEVHTVVVEQSIYRGTPFSRTKQQGQQQDQKLQHQSTTSRISPPSLTLSSRRIDWSRVVTSSKTSTSPQRSVDSGTTSRLIRANGGASTPPAGSSPFENTGTSARVMPPAFPENQLNPLPQKKRPIQQLNVRAEQLGRSSMPSPRREPRRSSGPNFDSDEDDSWKSRLKFSLPSISSLANMNPFRRSHYGDALTSATLDAWKADDDDEESRNGFLAKLFRSKAKGSTVSVDIRRPDILSSSYEPESPLTELMNRCGNGKSASLLTAADKRRCSRVGVSQAAMDMITLTFLLFGLKQLPGLDRQLLPNTMLEVFTLTLPRVLSCLVNGMETFAPFFFAAAFLSIQTRKLIFEAIVKDMLASISSSIHEEVQYGVLFLRIFSATVCSRDVPERLKEAARAQIVSKVDSVRIIALTVFLVTSMVTMTTNLLGPLVADFVQLMNSIVVMEEWKTSPSSLNKLVIGIAHHFVSFLGRLKTIFAEEARHMSESPVFLAYGFSVALSLAAVTLVSTSGRSSKITTMPDSEPDEDEDELQQQAKFSDRVSNLGVSSASRLNLLSDNGGIDAALERWRQMIPRELDTTNGVSIPSLFRLVAKCALSASVLVVPLAVYGYVGLDNVQTFTNPVPSWSSSLDVGVTLLFTYVLSLKTLLSTTVSNELKSGVGAFLSSLATAIEDRRETKLAPATPSSQFQSPGASAAGLVVQDLWAAQTSKRAWATRGANLWCRNGEVLVVLGDDAAGKSQLLTAIAESVYRPPRRALTTNLVKGSISIGGIEIDKWDSKQLLKKVGLMLSDVRTISDFSQVLSGVTLEDILDPAGGVREMSQGPGANERACMMLAMKITGLYTSLLPRLPSKMSTVVTANEEDITKLSPLRPLYHLLSPFEWSKLLLTRVLCQAVYNNDNPIASTDRVDSCLVGSILLLNDVTMYLTETEEAQLLRDLRRTGAATVLTSNRWITGRHADRVVIVKDGAVVETGSHAELLNRGPQQSLYAAKWLTMTQA